MKPWTGNHGRYRNVAQGVADSVSVTDQDMMEQEPRPKPPRRLGLSGKLFLLTLPLVAIACLLIYVPAIANFWTNRLNDRLAAAWRSGFFAELSCEQSTRMDLIRPALASSCSVCAMCAGE